MATIPPSQGSGAQRGPGPFRESLSLTKPGITFLIVLVAVAGYFIALPSRIDWITLALLIVTGAAASGGAAALNHYFDRDLDRQMHRTRHRPLAEESRAPPRGVALAGGLLLGGGIVAASVGINPLTGLSILLGGVTYVVVYTIWLKRRSSWNIVIGGFAGSAPVLAGSAAAVGHWTGGALALALLVFLWTPPHFWSLAVLLREDYARARLPMLPRMEDLSYSGKVIVVSAALLVPAGLLVGLTGALTLPVLIALLVFGAVFVALTWPLRRTVTPATARRGFIYSGPYLLLVVAVCLVNFALVTLGVARFG
ncbi:MAG: heme o synthase [Thermoplasmata archaeon]